MNLAAGQFLLMTRGGLGGWKACAVEFPPRPGFSRDGNFKFLHQLVLILAPFLSFESVHLRVTKKLRYCRGRFQYRF